MPLPFSHDAFLDVFGTYNTQLWAAALLLWLATAVVAWQWLTGGRPSERLVLAVLAVHWAWSGIAYHWVYFRAINPAASVFGAAFVLQALLFLWRGVGSTGQVAPPSGLRGAVGGAFVLYGLAYPGVGLALGLVYPRLPLFAVPCPTTLVTAGFLIAAVRPTRLLMVIPLLWAAVGSSAAFALGMTADLALLAAGGLLILDLIVPSALGRPNRLSSLP